MMPFKYAILGDIHANWPALQAVLADAEEQGANRYACVGDVVGYTMRYADTFESARLKAEAEISL